MVHLSPTKPPDWEQPETPRQARSVDFLLNCAELLKAQPGPKAIAQRLTEQTHASLFPVAVAMISEEDGRFYLSAFASQDERTDRIAMEQDLARPYGSLAQAARKALSVEQAGF